MDIRRTGQSRVPLGAVTDLRSVAGLGLLGVEIESCTRCGGQPKIIATCRGLVDVA